MKNQHTTAIYMDAENVSSLDFNLKEVLLFLKKDAFGQSNLVIRSAYGDQNTVRKSLKSQVADANFTIIDTPSIGKKNRGDLMVSLDAFETLMSPHISIDRYVFMTSDCDFTVIADKLRKFGKEVWLVCRKSDEGRPLIVSSFDKLIFLEKFLSCQSAPVKTPLQNLFVRALNQIPKFKYPVNASLISENMRKIDPGFSPAREGMLKFTEVLCQMEEIGLIKLDQLEAGTVIVDRVAA